MSQKQPWTVRIADRLDSMQLYRAAPAPGGDPELSWQQQQQWFEIIKGGVAQSELVVADQVSDYVFTISSKEYWSDDDLDCCIPPFPQTWIEWRTPSRVNSEGVVTANQSPLRAFGALILAAEVSEKIKA